ncbi:hypothetical protein Tco_0643824 [Tanacetum coccineum]
MSGLICATEPKQAEEPCGIMYPSMELLVVVCERYYLVGSNVSHGRLFCVVVDILSTLGLLGKMNKGCLWAFWRECFVEQDYDSIPNLLKKSSFRRWRQHRQLLRRRQNLINTASGISQRRQNVAASNETLKASSKQRRQEFCDAIAV